MHALICWCCVLLHEHAAPLSQARSCAGWSFVKNSRRFYDDTAGILRNILLGGDTPPSAPA
jgi:hypothetical protein